MKEAFFSLESRAWAAVSWGIVARGREGRITKVRNSPSDYSCIAPGWSASQKHPTEPVFEFPQLISEVPGPAMPSQ